MPLVAAAELDQRGELVEVAAQRAAGAGRVLEQQRAALGLGERLAKASPRAAAVLVAARPCARPGGRRRRAAPMRVAELERVGQRGHRLPRISSSRDAELIR